jgi:alkanesulfonate monooxygenase SsuD/methylene tetrahydromethanopterin reductase-like flavin-dependent oxidoreductase (luciferase family)
VEIVIIKKLFGSPDKDVNHEGKFVKLESTRLWTMPAETPPIYIATAGPVTAKKTGQYADGLITVGAPESKLEMIRAKCEEGCRDAGKDPNDFRYILQLHLSWAATDEEAMANAMTEWPNGGMKFPKQDIRSPLDFEQMAKLVRPEDFEGRMLISSDPDRHREQIQRFLDLGFDQIYLHNVGRNQADWIEVFGREVLPRLTA